MRAKNEKKDFQKSIKMTNEQGAIIQKKADESGVSFSRYIVEAAVRDENKALTPEVMVNITNIVNHAEQIAQQKNRRGIKNLRKEVEELWLSLR